MFFIVGGHCGDLHAATSEAMSSLPSQVAHTPTATRTAQNAFASVDTVDTHAMN
jgi:hypothetical protein